MVIQRKGTKMKVAILGNMNNNNFSLMRYFRDLGVDAYLILFTNDGTGTLKHFKPNNDTWDFEKWRPYVIQLDYPCAPVTILSDKLWFRFFFFVRYVYSLVFSKEHANNYRLVSKSKIILGTKEFDIFIGSGLSAAMLFRIGKVLDIFYPYETGIEFLGSKATIKQLRSSNFFKKILFQSITRAQCESIKKAKHCVNGELSLTKEVFDHYGIKFTPLNIPMIYNRENSPSYEMLGVELRSIAMDVRNAEFSIFHHGRQLWINDGNHTHEEWESISKHNDWLFKGFSMFVEFCPLLDTKLFVVDYGPDVEYSKKLCRSLGIENRVIWIPKMARKELMLIIKSATVCAGEFRVQENIIWGGTGWEVLASGKPLIQSFKFKEGEFEEIFGYPEPPLLKVENTEDVTKHFLNMSRNVNMAKEIGIASKIWFDTFNGKNLAREWLNLLLPGDKKN